MTTSTRERIIRLTDTLVREQGYNAFSFYDISRRLNIKNASIHYHFPTKTDLAMALVEMHSRRLQDLQQSVADKDPYTKLNAFMSIYDRIHTEGTVCLVGSLGTDLKTVEPQVARELKVFAGKVLSWVTDILEEGRNQMAFAFAEPSRTRALMVITNMLAAVQLSRLTGSDDFSLIRDSVVAGIAPAAKRKSIKKRII